MATEPLIELGTNYELDEDSNGNFVIRDSGGNAILTYNDTNTRWEVAQDMVPATDGTEQLGAASKAWGSVSTANIDINGADLVSSGDFVGVDSHIAFSRSRSTTSTSYDRDRDYFVYRPAWNQIEPTNAKTSVLFCCLAVPGTDESMSVRLHNTTDSETIVEQTGITSTTDITQMTSYSPTSKNRPFIDVEIKTDTGNNASELRETRAVVGVQV